MQTRNQESETDARQQRRSLRFSFWDGTLLPSSAKWLFSRLAQQQVCPAGWPRTAIFGAELLLRHRSGYEAKKAELNQGVKSCHATPRSQEHKTVMAGSRAGAQGEPSALTNAPALFCPKPPDGTSGAMQNPWQKRAHLEPPVWNGPQDSSFSQPSQVSTSHLFSFLMCLLNLISIQETWLIETKVSVRHAYMSDIKQLPLTRGRAALRHFRLRVLAHWRW